MSDEIVDDSYTPLINDLAKNRTELDDMIKDLRLFRKAAVESLTGKDLNDVKVDFRDKGKYSKFKMEEMLKMISSFYSTELSIRKQIDASLEKQFLLMKKVTGDDNESILTSTDIASIARQIEKIEGKVLPFES